MLFLFTTTTAKAIKLACKHISIWLGHDSKTAFWRRPAGSARNPDSPGFPSSHTANSASVWIFLMKGLEFEYGLFYAISIAVGMALGRVSDENHTIFQTVAGLLLGTVLGVSFANQIPMIEKMEKEWEYWRYVTFAALLGAVGYVVKTLPKMIHSLKYKFLRKDNRILPENGEDSGIEEKL